MERGKWPGLWAAGLQLHTVVQSAGTASASATAKISGIINFYKFLTACPSVLCVLPQYCSQHTAFLLSIYSCLIPSHL